MRPLPRVDIRAIIPATPTRYSYTQYLQAKLGKDPWKVTIASMLIRQLSRNDAELAFWMLLDAYPRAEYLCRASVAPVLQVCPVYPTKARQLIRFSSAYLGEGWETFQELPGVGEYVADAVGVFCFGYGDIASKDLQDYVHDSCTEHEVYTPECHWCNIAREANSRMTTREQQLHRGANA